MEICSPGTGGPLGISCLTSGVSNKITNTVDSLFSKLQFKDPFESDDEGKEKDKSASLINNYKTCSKVLSPNVQFVQTFERNVEVKGKIIFSDMPNNFHIPETFSIGDTKKTLSPVVSAFAKVACMPEPLSEEYCDMLPGLPNDIAKHCLALVLRSEYKSVRLVSKTWRNYLQSREFILARRLVGMLDECLYMLASSSPPPPPPAAAAEMRWQALNFENGNWDMLPAMPGPLRTASNSVVMDEKLVVLGGLINSGTSVEPSKDVYQYHPVMNKWTSLASMNIARYEFGCAVVNGLVYAVGGHGEQGESLASVEVYDPGLNKWTLKKSMRRPRWGCFACGLQGKLYVMGGRSTFTIGNTRYVDIFDPECLSWNEAKNGCVMVVAHAVLNGRFFCIEWKNERQLAIFDPSEHSWKRVPIPLTRSMTVGFCFATFNGKLLLFANHSEPFYQTLAYDPSARSGSEWQILSITPPGSCVCSVTVKA